MPLYRSTTWNGMAELYNPNFPQLGLNGTDDRSEETGEDTGEEIGEDTGDGIGDGSGDCSVKSMGSELSTLDIVLPAALAVRASLEEELVLTAKALEQDLELGPFVDSFCGSKEMKT
ncbi:hypothetical protein AAG906_001758 [Vitis piasezkii]